jgi:hypothetical protein
LQKRYAIVGAVLLVALAGVWLWGASGTWTAERALAAAELRNALVQGRSNVLEARLDIYNVNFGEASRHLEAAKAELATAKARLSDAGRQPDVDRLAAAVAKIDDAQRAAGALNQDANTIAAEAAAVIASLLNAPDTR